MAELPSERALTEKEAKHLQDFLKKNAALFANSLNVRGLTLELLSACVIDDDELEALNSLKRAGKSNRELTEDLWRTLRGKDSKQLLAFVRCVHEKQAHLVEDVAYLLKPVTAEAEEESATPSETISPVQPSDEASCLGSTIRSFSQGSSFSSEVAHGSLGRGLSADPSVSKEEVTDLDIRRLAKTAGSKWKKVGRYLVNCSADNDLAFGEEDLTEISEKESVSEDRMICLLQMWRAMSSLHRWAELYKAFNESDLGCVAVDVFQQQ